MPIRRPSTGGGGGGGGSPGGANGSIQYNNAGSFGGVNPVPVAKGGTNSQTALGNNCVIISSGGKIVEATAITASKVLVSDSNGIPVASSASGVAHLSSGALTGSNVVLTSEVTGVLPVANGGTNSSTALNSNRFVVSSGGKLVEASAIAAGKAVITDSNGLPIAGTISVPNGGTGATSFAAGVLTGQGSGAITIVAPGTSGNVLTSIGTAWTSAAPSGATTIGTFASSPQPNGGSISSGVLVFGPSDATTPGMISTGSQTIAGTKTFTGVVIGGANSHYHMEPAVHAAGTAGSLTVNFANASVQTLSVGSSGGTLSFSNIEAGGTYVLVITQYSGSQQALAFTGVVWPDATPPDFTQAATSSINQVTLVSYDGTNLIGSFGLNCA